MRITLPYGNQNASFEVEERYFAGMYDPVPTDPCADYESEILHALEHPIGTPGLENILDRSDRVNIIIDDMSRPTPVDKILPVLLRKIREIGIARENIRIVTALGSHRPMTEDELRNRVGASVYSEYEVANSEFKDPDKLVEVGMTPEGVRILASKVVMDGDRRIGIGNLVPHPVMGWGGGGKILYPGVTNEEIVSYFHLKASLYDQNMFGMTTTPIREMMESWVDTIGLDFIVNTILTPDLKLYKAVAGHYVQAYRAGVEMGKRVMGYPVKEKVDVVVVSSHPADQDFWQSPKAIYASEEALKGSRGGTIILVSPNYEGIGNHTEFPYYMGRDDGDTVVSNIIKGDKPDGDPLAIAIGNSMSKMRRRRKLVVVSDGVTADEMARCGCIHYPLSMLQKAVDDAISEYDNVRLCAIRNGAETYLYE